MNKEVKNIVGLLNQNTTEIHSCKSRVDKAEELAKILEANGFDFIDMGLSRHVFASKNKSIVVKLEVNEEDNDFNQNQQEVENWLSCPSKAKKYLLPILAYAEDYSWLVMPYCPDVAWDDYAGFEGKLMRNNIYYKDFGHSNVGMYGERMVIRDYGYGNSKEWILVK